MAPTGGRRNRQWALAADSPTLDAAAAALGALGRAQLLASRLNRERAVWHAESKREGTRARNGLALLQERLHARGRKASSSVREPEVLDGRSELDRALDDSLPTRYIRGSSWLHAALRPTLREKVPGGAG
ncbi:hypothetical protein MUG78_17285 [Gordonia alkaliphila]|uniref:hypothetical protein n=1 Tax=Gordonia alkaliphila TaxID=1053547 RepID=UPI001FF0FA1D|nr:hypothetical protein [Gordonia alkaliphila]MCK0441155.1 hypothetical protein [Gordonia alkaliphila]